MVELHGGAALLGALEALWVHWGVSTACLFQHKEWKNGIGSRQWPVAGRNCVGSANASIQLKWLWGFVSGEGDVRLQGS